MASDEREFGKTDLIDVGEIPTEFDDDFTRDRGEVTGREGAEGAAAGAEGFLIAEIKDRFAALAVDGCLLYCLYWALMPIFRSIALGQAAGPIPAAGTNGLLFHGIFLLLCFLLFTLFEFALSATPGKMLCHLSVRKADGAPPSIGAAAIRNLLRFVDIALCPLLIPLAMMEWSPWHRRLGDLAAGTVVIRRLTRAPRQYALSLDIVSSASRRAIAFLFDLTLVGAFGFGYALLLSPDQPLVSMLLVVLAPIFLLAFFTLPEWLTHTSPGKWILGLAICHEDGSAIGLSTAFVRNLWRVVDCNPAGFLTCLFSLRRQRPGDSAAGSVVVRVQREWRGFAGLIGALLIACAVTYAGISNRSSFLSGNFQINFLPSIDIRGLASAAPASRDENLTIRNFRFAAGDAETLRKPSIFQPGETLYLLFDLSGFGVQEGKAWIQEDLSVSYPDGSVGLKLENINDFNREITDPGPVRFENHIALPANAQAGRYTVTITLRDKNARREIKEQRFFYITPAEGGSQPAAPAEAAPPAPAPEATPPQSNAAAPAATPPAAQELGAPPPPPPPPPPGTVVDR